MTVRVNTVGTFPDLALVVVHIQFDEKCTEHLSHVRVPCQERVSAQSWWQIYKDIASLVLDPVAVDEIFAETQSWTKVANQLPQVATTSSIDNKLFGWANMCATSETVGNSISERLDVITTDIDEDKKKRFFNQCMEEGDALNVGMFLSQKRDSKLKCKGVDFMV